MRGRVHARRTLKGLVADLRIINFYTIIYIGIRAKPRLPRRPGTYLRIEVMTTRQRPSLPLAVGRRSEVHDEIATVGFATNDYFLLRETDRHPEFRIIVDVMIIADAWKIVVIHLKLQHDRVRALSIAQYSVNNHVIV